jgi:hypothetical protein
MSKAYNAGLRTLASGFTSYIQDPIGVLVVNNYTFNISHTVVSNVVANEVENSFGTGYSRRFLSAKQVETTSNNTAMFAENVTYQYVQTNAFWDAAIVYAVGPDDNTSTLLFHIDIDQVQAVGADIRVDWNANGIFVIQN